MISGQGTAGSREQVVVVLAALSTTDRSRLSLISDPSHLTSGSFSFSRNFSKLGALSECEKMLGESSYETVADFAFNG